MGSRFRRSTKIAPGVRVNIGKKSIGVSTGVKGAHVSVNSQGRKSATIGIPGTGYSYTAYSKKRAHEPSDSGYEYESDNRDEVFALVDSLREREKWERENGIFLDAPIERILPNPLSGKQQTMFRLFRWIFLILSVLFLIVFGIFFALRLGTVYGVLCLVGCLACFALGKFYMPHFEASEKARIYDSIQIREFILEPSENQTEQAQQTLLQAVKERRPPFDDHISVDCSETSINGQPAFPVTVNGQCIGRIFYTYCNEIHDAKDRLIDVCGLYVGGGATNDDGEFVRYYARVKLAFSPK